MSRFWSEREQEEESRRWAEAIARTEPGRSIADELWPYRPGPAEFGPDPHGIRFPWFGLLLVTVACAGFLLGWLMP